MFAQEALEHEWPLQLPRSLEINKEGKSKGTPGALKGASPVCASSSLRHRWVLTLTCQRQAEAQALP